MLDRVLRFTRALREAGLPVGASESIDALRSLQCISLQDRESVRAALSCTMVKNEGHRPAFDTLFGLYFGARGALDTPDRDAVSTDALVSQVTDAIAAGDDASIQALARTAVAMFGRLESAASNDWYSHYQVMRTLDLDRLVRALEEEAAGAETAGWSAGVRRAELRRSARSFRQATLDETRRRVAEQRGPEAVAAYAVAPLPEEADFFGLSTDLDDLRKSIRPLARKLATRVAMKRRRHRRGQLDIRHTVRRSLGSGGVPLEPRFRHRVPHRPELFILCDVSGSVGRFARFTLMLTHALSSQFSRVRSFAFIDKLDEVTRYFDHEDFLVGVDRMNREADVVWTDGHSDYGNCLSQFHEDFGSDVGPRTTMLVLGDARTNYRARKAWVLKELGRQARRIYWLNPEPRRDWDTGDSAASEYAEHVDAMVEVRNLKQLEAFIEKVI